MGAVKRDARFREVSVRLAADLVDLALCRATPEDADATWQIDLDGVALDVHTLDLQPVVKRALGGSYSLRRAWPTRGKVFRDGTSPRHRVQWIRVVADPSALTASSTLGCVVTAAAGLVASFDEPVAIVWASGQDTSSQGVRAAVLDGTGMRPVALEGDARRWPGLLVDAMGLDPREDSAAGRGRGGHVFVVGGDALSGAAGRHGHPRPRDAWPEPHRVLLVTDRQPERPNDLPHGVLDRCLDLLRPGAVASVRVGGRVHRTPLFSSLVVLHLLKARPPAPTGPRAMARTWLRAARGAGAEGGDYADHAEVADALEPDGLETRLTLRTRLRRDRVAVRLLAGDRIDARGQDLVDLAAPRPLPRVRDGWRRVGRALTNRQVGFALSGGGAYAFAYLAFLEALLGSDDDGGDGAVRVPVDVVSSASGGSILGAYLAAYDGRTCRAMKDNLKDNVGWLNPAVIASTVSLAALRFGLDVDLHGATVEDSEVRFAPATLFAPSAARAGYAMHATVRGTLGEAVRRSGALPPVFPAVQHPSGTFYDGMLADVLPTSALFAFGADFLVAGYLIPGPDTGSRLERRLGRVLAALPITARLAGGLSAWAFTAERLGQLASNVPHCYVAPPPTSRPFLDMVRFGRMLEDGGDASKGHWQREADGVAARWETFRTRPTRGDREREAAP